MTIHGGDDSAELDDIVSMLVTASRTLVAIAASSLEHVEDMLTLSEFRALVVLQAQGPCLTSSLARRLGVSPEAGERVAKQLSEGSFALRDGRELLTLTERGDDLVNEVTRHRRIALTGVVERMEVDERRLLVDALIAFAQAAGEPLAVQSVSDHKVAVES